MHLHHLQGVLTLNLLTTTIFAPPSNASKWQMGFKSAFKGLTLYFVKVTELLKLQLTKIGGLKFSRQHFNLPISLSSKFNNFINLPKCKFNSHLLAYEDGTDRMFRNVGI